MPIVPRALRRALDLRPVGRRLVLPHDGGRRHRFCSPADGNCSAAPLSNSGRTYDHTFTAAGTFPYYCSAHVSLGMTGTVKAE